MDRGTRSTQATKIVFALIGVVAMVVIAGMVGRSLNATPDTR